MLNEEAQQIWLLKVRNAKTNHGGTGRNAKTNHGSTG